MPGGREIKGVEMLRPAHDDEIHVVETSDGGLLYVEVRGTGRPVFLVHGWTMSSAFWVRQKEGLAAEFKVVTMDLRAHGNSSKTLQGHTMPRYAGDIRSVIDYLNLEGVVLAGWSLGGPVVLEYWKTYGPDRVSALALVEMTPGPMSSQEWNTHALKGHNFDALNEALISLQEDRRAYGTRFVDMMFKNGKAPREERAWMVKEHLKTPTPAAIAAYADYVMRDYTGVLGTITVPVLVAAGNSGYMVFGPKTGQYVADTIPKSRLAVFENSGHLPFYEEAESFNEALADLLKR